MSGVTEQKNEFWRWEIRESTLQVRQGTIRKVEEGSRGSGKPRKSNDKGKEGRREVEKERRRNKVGEERWVDGFCVKCKAEKEGSRLLARKSSFAEIVKNLLSIDRELQAQRLSVHTASGKGKSTIPPVPPVPFIEKRRGMR
ncbi:hypothetical protein BPOR_0214g00080 [Botrytis porri]|uniref:Uncharacterized protein n=1 Tax=Botrytis porri TaxID=87229 RepID=A0A4Z1KRD5_9HELO|nr:hypothetical protein BPOR_0214g00080 [Botrytis porri]